MAAASEVAAALGLLRAGHAVSVHERAPALRREGAAVTLWSNGSAVLDSFVVPLTGLGQRIEGLDGLEIEIVTFSVKAQDERTAPERLQITRGKAMLDGAPTRPVFDPTQGRALETAIVERTILTPGARVSGPAVIVERETSTVVTSPFDVVMQDDGTLLLTRKEMAA